MVWNARSFGFVFLAIFSLNPFKSYARPALAPLELDTPCAQLKNQARDEANHPELTRFQRFEIIFNRDKNINTALLAKARTCQSSTNQPGSECEGLESPAMISHFEAVLSEMRQCDPKVDVVADQVARELGCSRLVMRPIRSLPAVNSSPDEPKATVCQIIGLDTKFCKDKVEAGIRYGAAELDRLCRVPAVILTATPSGDRNEDAFKSCNADIIQTVCGQFTASNIKIAEATSNGEISLAEATRDATINFANDHLDAFNTNAQKCIETYAKEELVALFQHAAQDLGKTAFGRGIQSAEAYLKQERVKAVIARACTYATDHVVNNLGAMEQSQVTQGCDSVFNFDKQRVSACLQTTKDFACDAMAGNIQLAATLGMQNDATLARTWVDLASGVLESGCRAGGTASGAACTLINKSSAYISDSLRGRSNPWADCVGTPAMGVCLSQKWREYSTGVYDADYTVGREEPKKQADNRYVGRVCLCQRSCVADNWGSDQVLYTGNFYYVAESGDVGERLCASQNYRVVYPEGMTANGGSSNVYIRWDNCEIATASGKTPQLISPARTIDAFTGGAWGRFQISAPGTCGGSTDQGI